MTKGTSFFLKTAGVYTTANVLNAAIPFLLLPFLTKHLSPADYGLVAMFQVLVMAVLPFIGFNFEGAMSRQYFERDRIDFPQYVGNVMLLLVLSTLAVAAIFYLFRDSIAGLTDFPVPWLWAVVIYAFSHKAIELPLTYWRLQYKAVHYGIFRIVRTLLDIGLSIFLIKILGHSWEGRIEGQLLAAAVFVFIALYFVLRSGWAKKGINKEYLKNIINFGGPLIPHILGVAIIFYSDRIFITNMVGQAEMGLYSVGHQVGMVIYLLQNSFNQAWVPWFYEQLKLESKSANRQIVNITYIYIVVILLITALMVLLAEPFFNLFLGKEFLTAQEYVGWVALGFAFNGMYKMVVNYLFFLEKTKIVGMITILTAMLNLLMNYILIKWNGPIGAAQATAFSFFIQFIAVWYVSAGTYRMPWFFSTPADE